MDRSNPNNRKAAIDDPDPTINPMVKREQMAVDMRSSIRYPEAIPKVFQGKRYMGVGRSAY